MRNLLLTPILGILVLLTASSALAADQSAEKIEYSIQLLEDGAPFLPATHHSSTAGNPIYLQTTVGENPYKGTAEQKITFQATPTLDPSGLRLVGTLKAKSSGEEALSVNIDQLIDSSEGISFPIEYNGVEYQVLLKLNYPQG